MGADHSDFLFIVDRDGLYKQGIGVDEEDVERQAAWLSRRARARYSYPCCIALVSKHDEVGQRAYRKHDFTVYTVNGNRFVAICLLAARVNRQSEGNPPDEVLLVTQDDIFYTFCAHAVQPAEVMSLALGEDFLF
jgi:hypothetical protein